MTGLVGMCPLYSILGIEYLPDEEGLSGAACAPAVEPMKPA